MGIVLNQHFVSFWEIGKILWKELRKPLRELLEGDQILCGSKGFYCFIQFPVIFCNWNQEYCKKCIKTWGAG
jgi:hypothetical protein